MDVGNVKNVTVVCYTHENISPGERLNKVYTCRF